MLIDLILNRAITFYPLSLACIGTLLNMSWRQLERLATFDDYRMRIGSVCPSKAQCLSCVSTILTPLGYVLFAWCFKLTRRCGQDQTSH